MSTEPVALILVAAGPGSRLGADRPKALVELGGRTLLEHAFDSIAATRWSVEIFLVVVSPAAHVDTIRDLAAQWPGDGRVVAGGAERQDSVRAGLTACPDAAIVVVHDAARPFLTEETLSSVIATASTHGAAVAAMPATDTVKIVGEDGRVESTPPRDRVWLAQTPQAFRREVLTAAHASAGDNSSTDDASLVEMSGGRVQVVRGDPMARKITTVDDLHWAEWVLQSGQWPR